MIRHRGRKNYRVCEAGKEISANMPPVQPVAKLIQITLQMLAVESVKFR
jgi:hypothetical protein